MMDGLYKLKGVVQHYTWGGQAFIPSLLNQANENQKPFAEYWLGAHPASPSVLVEEHLSLQEAIQKNPVAILGKRIKEKFASLPYLFKVLDVRQMLSIQVHPSKASAIEEYAKENAKGIALTAPNRNYKDQNHKPELMVALSDFWLLHGFKEEASIKKILQDVKALQFLQASFSHGGYKAMYEEVMTMPQQKVNEALRPLLKEIIPLYEAGKLQKEDEHFWAARAALSFNKENIVDRGIFSIYVFNLLHLKTGEGIYQAAGLPHAYLEGQNIEVMANSDNVLRAGLTDKHIDVAELMKHVKFEATHPKIIRATNAAQQSFASPAEEFLLTKYTIKEKNSAWVETASIFFVLEGDAQFSVGDKTLTLKRGEAAIVLAGKEVTITPVSASAIVYGVTTPLDKK